MLQKFIHKVISLFSGKQRVDDQDKDGTIKTEGMTGKDFEFLITPGDFEIKDEDFDRVMTPVSIAWKKIVRDDWDYYVIGKDEFSYSREEPGIQMTFNDEIGFDKAKETAEEVVTNLKRYAGKDIELLIIPKNKVLLF